MTTALFIGRFQPFHLGHLEIVKEALGSNDMLYIVIGSAQEKGTAQNPYSVEDRKKMVESGVGELLERIKIVPIDDIGNDEEWVRHVLKYTTKIDAVFSGQNQQTERLFSGAGFKVIPSPLFENITATEIRNRKRQGMRWHHMVPEQVVEYLESIDG